MKILITGGLGFVGTRLSELFLERDHDVTVVDHSPEPKAHTPSGVTYVAADTTERGRWQEEIAVQDIVFNLAGASIFRRWNKAAKKLMYESRILTTRNVVEAMKTKSAGVLVSTSAVGYYGFHGDEELTEQDGPGDDFLARLCADWEREASEAARDGVRVVLARLGIVLGPTGGALGQMVSPFKKFVGGPLGSGNQWFSWIHMEDLVNACVFILENDNLDGPVNVCAPNPVRNRDMAHALGKVLSRPSFVPTPAFSVKLILGEFGSVLLEGQRVLPGKLVEAGFSFHYPEIRGALQDLVGKPVAVVV